MLKVENGNLTEVELESTNIWEKVVEIIGGLPTYLEYPGFIERDIIIIAPRFASKDTPISMLFGIEFEVLEYFNKKAIFEMPTSLTMVTDELKKKGVAGNIVYQAEKIFGNCVFVSLNPGLFGEEYIEELNDEQKAFVNERVCRASKMNFVGLQDDAKGSYIFTTKLEDCKSVIDRVTDKMNAIDFLMNMFDK